MGIKTSSYIKTPTYITVWTVECKLTSENIFFNYLELQKQIFNISTHFFFFSSTTVRCGLSLPIQFSSIPDSP
jgi:hypothetical protein